MRWKPLTTSTGRTLLLWPVSVIAALSVAVGTIQLAQRDFDAGLSEAARFEASNPEIVKALKSTDLDLALSTAVDAALDGAPFSSKIDLNYLQRDVWSKHLPERCQARPEETSVEVCARGDVEAKRTVYLLGDSHAGMWLAGLSKLGSAEGFKLVPLLKHGCSPYKLKQIEDEKTCSEFRIWAADHLEQAQPEAIILAGRGFFRMHEQSEADRNQEWTAGIQDTVNRLSKVTPNVVLLGDVPDRPHESLDCITLGGNNTGDCLIEKTTSIEVDSNAVTKQAVAGTSATYVETAGLVCGEKWCPLTVGKSVVYYDDDHVSRSWSRRAWPQMRDLILPTITGQSPTVGP